MESLFDYCANAIPGNDDVTGYQDQLRCKRCRDQPQTSSDGLRLPGDGCYGILVSFTHKP